MPKHQRLALPRVLTLAVVTSVLVGAVRSSGGTLAREVSPNGGLIFKRQRQDQDGDNPVQSLVASLLSSLAAVEPPTSFGFGVITVTSTTSTPSSTRLETPTSSSSAPSITNTGFNPTLTTSASTSTSTTSIRRGPPTTTVTITSRTPSSDSSTSSPATSTTGQTTTNVNTNLIVNSRTSVTLGTTVSFAATYTRSATRSASVDASLTTSEDSNRPESSDRGFMGNKGAVAATFTVVGLIGAGLVICTVLFIRKRLHDRKLNKADWDDMNDTASMAEFASASAHIGGATGAAAILPSAALARQPSSHGQGSGAHEMHEDRPDSVLAMPPVMNYERPRDSAYDIVPVAPPQLRAPDNHNSFGSMMGADPFAGAPTTTWQDAERHSAYGAGQAGRGAGVNALGGGYNMQPYPGGVGVAIGGDQDAYGGATYGGDQQATGYQYAYPSHVYGQQYTGNPQQGGYGYGY